MDKMTPAEALALIVDPSVTTNGLTEAAATLRNALCDAYRAHACTLQLLPEGTVGGGEADALFDLARSVVGR